MEIIENGRALLLRLRNPQQVTNAIPKSRALPDNKVVVNWGVDEAQTLKNMNIKAPSPIEKQYQWSGSHAPFAHQKTTSAFLTMNRKAFCFNEQGTGKTASSIWAADFLLQKQVINRVLIICPLSIMDSAWRNDLFTFAPHRTVDVAYGSSKKRKEILAQGAEFVVIKL